MPPRRPAAITRNFFPMGDDLPLFSGAPPRPRDRPFVPETATAQGAFFNLRPDPFNTLGGVLPALHPTEEVTYDDTCDDNRADANAGAVAGETDLDPGN